MPSFSFDARRVQPGLPQSVIPPGTYSATVTSAELRPARSGDGRYLQIAMQITGGLPEPRTHWLRLHIESADAHVRDIAARELASLCRACHINSFTDCGQLIGLTCRVVIGTRRRADGDSVSVIREYLPQLLTS